MAFHSPELLKIWCHTFFSVTAQKKCHLLGIRLRFLDWMLGALPSELASLCFNHFQFRCIFCFHFFLQPIACFHPSQSWHWSASPLWWDFCWLTSHLMDQFIQVYGNPFAQKNDCFSISSIDGAPKPRKFSEESKSHTIKEFKKTLTEKFPAHSWIECESLWKNNFVKWVFSIWAFYKNNYRTKFWVF